MPEEANKSSSPALWRNRNFMLLWSGQFVSWIGTAISGIALPLLVLTVTGSPIQAGIISGIRGLVYIVWAIPAGALIDRWDRRMVMLIANLGSGVAIGSIFCALLVGHITVILLYVAGAIEGSFFVFANLSRFAAIPRVVLEEQIPAAAAQTSVADYTALLIGPALGGIIYQAVGPMISFFLDALSYFINTLSILFITVPLQRPRERTQRTIKDEIREGFTWLWHHPIIRFLNMLTAGGTMVNAGLYLLIIVLARHHHASSGVIGIIFAVGAGGGILGAFCASWIQRRFLFNHILLATTMLSFLAFALYFFAYNDSVLAGITLVYNLITSIYEVTVFSYAAHVIPDGIRGRVTSLTRLVVLGSYSLGFFAMGFFIQDLGSAWAIILFSSLLLSLAVLTLLNNALRQDSKALQKP